MEHIPEIRVKLVDPENQRFSDECGDWFYEAEGRIITVYISRMSDWRSELAVTIHEIFESCACLAADIDQTDVDFFDKKFYLTHDDGEAGEDLEAPYHSQHVGATFVEKESCTQSGLSWKEHEKIVDEA